MYRVSLDTSEPLAATLLEFMVKHGVTRDSRDGGETVYFAPSSEILELMIVSLWGDHDAVDGIETDPDH